MENMLKVNDKIKVHLYDTSGKEIKTRSYDNVFTVYENDGKLGIDWNTEKHISTCRSEIFTPFEIFANTVFFENVETGEKFRYSSIKNGIEKID